jgi:hypothetical protein
MASGTESDAQYILGEMTVVGTLLAQGKGASNEMVEAAVSMDAGAKAAQARLVQCLTDYNPQDREEYEEVVATWLASMLVLADHLAHHPRASTAASQAEQGQLPLPPTPPSKQDLAA